MFKSLFGGGKPTRDPTLGDPLAKKLVAELHKGDIDALMADLAPIRSGHWDERAFYAAMIGEQITDAALLAKFPDSALGNLIKGRAGIGLAWKARGGGRADTVTQDGWKTFFKHLDAAAQTLVRAGDQDPQDPTPFAFLQPAAMGMQLERKVSQGWLAEATQRDPYNQFAHRSHLMLLCEKWGGSHDEMFAFARATVKKLPPESTLNAILYQACQEYFQYFTAFEKKPESATAFAKEPAIRAESMEIYKRSLQRQKKIERVSDYVPHNLAAWWFYAQGIREVVREETRKIGPHFTDTPWQMYGDPADKYSKVSRL